AIQDDGKIVAAGSTGASQAEGQVAVFRYRRDGALDETFGVQGRAVSGLVGSTATGVALQRDGKIVVGGFVFSGSGITSIAVVRLGTDGQPDLGFGTNGVATVDVGGPSIALAIAIQRDGRIVVAGAANPSGGRQSSVLVRFNRDGSPDASFGTGGQVLTNLAGGFNEQLEALAIQEDGKIVAGGYSRLIPFRLVGTLARYNPDGPLHTASRTHRALL